jgi:hypothetical protein
VTGVLKQSGSPLYQCPGSQERVGVVVVKEVVLEVVEVNNVEVKITDVEEVTQEP